MCVCEYIHTLLLYVCTVCIHLVIYLFIYSCVLFIGSAPVAYLTIVNTLMYDVEEVEEGEGGGGILGVWLGGRGGGKGKTLAVILNLTVALLVLDDDII